ncbi:MAG: recombinase family protein [Lachnospiraceae bacterium]|nr:recombinase family protein [Lachnospiraceae bacterium]
MNIKFAYGRVSTDEQNLDRQLIAFDNYNIPAENLFCDKCTGKTDDREQYQMMKAILQRLSYINSKKNVEERDIIELYIEELDRLGRTKKIIRDEMQWFADHGIILRILEIPTTLIEIDPQNDWVLEMVNRIIIEVYTAVAEQEMEKRVKRQREGIEAAKARGVYKGRKPITVDAKLFENVYKRWRAGEFTALKAMDMLGLKTNTFYRMVKQYEQGDMAGFSEEKKMVRACKVIS